MKRRLATATWLGTLTAAALAMTLSGVGCGPHAEGQSAYNQQQQPPPGQQPGQYPQQQQGTGNTSTEAMIGDLLRDIEPGAGQGQGPAPAPTQTVAPPGPPPGGGDRLDTFEEDIARIRQIVPGWDNGTGLSIKFLKESTGKRLSLIYVDPTPPAYKDGPGLWMIQAKATSGDTVIGWAVILLKSLAPGRYEGSPSKQDVVLAVCMGETWDGKNPETTWSINPGSYAEITLQPGRGPGDLEGNFRGKLVDNKGTGFHTIENGYVYINR